MYCLGADGGVEEFAEASRFDFGCFGGIGGGGLRSSLRDGVDLLAEDGLAEAVLHSTEAEARRHDGRGGLEGGSRGVDSTRPYLSAMSSRERLSGRERLRWLVGRLFKVNVPHRREWRSNAWQGRLRADIHLEPELQVCTYILYLHNLLVLSCLIHLSTPSRPISALSPCRPNTPSPRHSRSCDSTTVRPPNTPMPSGTSRPLSTAPSPWHARRSPSHQFLPHARLSHHEASQSIYAHFDSRSHGV